VDPVEYFFYPGKMSQNLDASDHTKVLDGKKEINSLSSHVVSPDPKKIKFRMEFFEVVNETGPVFFSRIFPGYDENGIH
jgi:hypothetical protein